MQKMWKRQGERQGRVPRRGNVQDLSNNRRTTNYCVYIDQWQPLVQRRGVKVHGYHVGRYRTLQRYRFCSFFNFSLHRIKCCVCCFSHVEINEMCICYCQRFKRKRVCISYTSHYFLLYFLTVKLYNSYMVYSSISQIKKKYIIIAKAL